MLVKCEKCGYENFPQHRYCGMCAAELRLPAPAGAQPAPPPTRVPSPAAPKEVVAQQVSGPSFLGLANEPAETRSVSYLLEDEPPSHRGRNLILILVMIAGVAAAAWHWRQDLRVVGARFLKSPPPAATAPGTNDTQAQNSPAPAASDSPSATAPASSTNAVTPVEKPATGTNDQAPAAQTPTPPSASPAAAAPSGTTESTQIAQAEPPPSTQPQPSDTAPAPAATKPDETAEDTTQPAPAPKSPKTRAQRAAASASRVDDLEAEGEKYLYGNGVPENCTRARTNLLAAAQHSNAQAQSVLGTMYATGHCATRDLPTAYRWLGRSLRQDPGNTRIEQDLKVLWNQMTPEERKLALRDER